MPRILVVEGLTDATFFQELLRRLYLWNAEVETESRLGRERIPKIVRGTRSDGSSLEVEFVNQEGKARIPERITALLNADIRQFIVAQDINGDFPNGIVQSIGRVIYTHLGMAPPTTPVAGHRIEIEGGAIGVIPLGLHQDDELRALGITHHALEDYLIKLLLEDAELRQRAPELGGLLSEILPTVRRYDGDFNSSKGLFQLIKPIVQHGFSDAGVVQKLVADAEISILRTVVSPLLEDLDRALK